MIPTHSNPSRRQTTPRVRLSIGLLIAAFAAAAGCEQSGTTEPNGPTKAMLGDTEATALIKAEGRDWLIDLKERYKATNAKLIALEGNPRLNAES